MPELFAALSGHACRYCRSPIFSPPVIVTKDGIYHVACEAAERGVKPWDKRAADRLADEVAALVVRGKLATRTPVTDALEDYRNSPRSERSDRLADLEEEVERLGTLCCANPGCKDTPTVIQQGKTWCSWHRPET